MRFVMIILIFALAGRACADADIQDVRIVGNGDPTRIVVEANRALAHGIFAHEVNGARAITLDVSGAEWLAGDTTEVGGGGVTTYYWRDGRLTFELDRPLLVRRLLDIPPTGEALTHRIVIDLQTVSEVRFDQVAKRDAKRLAKRDSTELSLRNLPAPAPTEEALSAEAADMGPYIIVIDAGHGGRDPGTTVSRLVQEKEVVLKTALALRDRLADDKRYVVRLTRDDDTFVDHEDRVTLARNWGADLFISIHADSISKPDIEGASVYTLSTKGQRRVDSVAADNNWSIPLETGEAPEEVNSILENLVKRETLSNSTHFANLLLPELEKAGPILRARPKQGNLFVLLAPDVPAVLVELGFMSNRRDAKRLASRAGRDRAADAIARAIEAYFQEQDVRLAQN